MQHDISFRFHNGSQDHQSFTGNLNDTWEISLGTYSFDKNPFIGFIANVNVWNKTMEPEELRQRTLCNQTVSNKLGQGTIFNNSSEVTITGNLVKRKTFEESDTLCNRNNTKTNVFLPISQLTRDESEDLCRRLGKGVPIAGNFEDKEYFDNYFNELHRNRRYVEECSYFDNGRIRTWIPYKVPFHAPEMFHDKTKQPLLWKISEKFYSPFYLSRRVNRTGYVCGSAYFGRMKKYENLESDLCTDKKCTGCEISNSHENTSKLKLRGLCSYSAFDKTYQVHYDPDTQIYYKGTGKSIIQFDFEKSYWVLQNVNNPNVTAICKVPFKTLAIGNHDWNISGDKNCKDGTHPLSLTSCNEDEFTCNNGLCINLTQRCDGKVDCKDDSDELDCEVVEVGDSYNNLLAPTPPEGNKASKISLNITIIIHTISGFSEIEGTFDSQFSLAMVWFDKRLSYHYLRDDPKTLSKNTIDKLWFPGFKFENTKTKVMIVPDEKSSVEVRKKGNGTHAEDHNGENKLVYSGKDNLLSFKRFYPLTFQCSYNLR